MNLINQLSCILKNFINLEKNNLFCYLILCFIIGLNLATVYVEYYDFILSNKLLIIIFIIGCICLLGLIYTYIFRLHWLKVFFLLKIFFLLGFCLFYCKSLCKSTKFIENSLESVNLTAEVNEVNNKKNTKYQTIYLKNIKIHNYENINNLKSIKLINYYYFALQKGDVINVFVDLKDIYTINPYDTFTKYNAFWKNIEANGVNVKKISKVGESQNKKFDLRLYINCIKQYLYQKIDKNLSNASIGIAKALILGDSTHISATDRKLLVNSGLGPFIAISGLHIGIIMVFLFLSIRILLSLIPYVTLNINTKKIAAIATIIVLSCYLILLGNIPSAWRSGIMAILFMTGIIFNFYTFSIRNLLTAIFILLFFKPEYIGYPGFLLSFIATAVIIKLFNSSFIRRFFITFNKNIILKFLKYIILTSLLSLTVSIAVFPILVYFFNNIPLYGILANLVVTPLFSIVIMPFLFVSMIFPEPFCGVLFSIVDISIVFMLKVSAYISSLTFSNIYFSSFNKNILIIYIILLLFFIICSSKLKYLALVVFILIYVYIYRIPYPHIMIDKHMSLLAFFNNNTNKYIFNTLKGRLHIRNQWVKDSSKIEHKNLKYNKAFKCDKNTNCIMNIEGFVVSYHTTKDYLKEACFNSQLIIVNDNYDVQCRESIIIDKSFVEKFGSTFIYFIKPNKIKIVSNKKTLTIKLNVENNDNFY